ncbi:MAG: dihydroorotase [bacterium]
MPVRFPDSFTLPLPDDFHIHLRQGEALSRYVNAATAAYGRVIVMPNTTPPIRDEHDLLRYREEILDAAADAPWFVPLMTFKIATVHTADDVQRLAAAGATAGKLYPQGATTNAEDGVADIGSVWHVFAAMERCGLVLCIHGEDPAAFVMDREDAFLPVLTRIASDFPDLRIVLEHVTTARAVELVESLPDTVAATITVHHLLLTLDDVVGGFLNPHVFCKPIMKRPEDRAALARAAVSDSPKFFFGSDSAPHPVGAKESSCGCAGVYTAPVAMPLLIDFFERHGTMERLRAFCCERGRAFYGLPVNAYEVRYRRESWTVPQVFGDVVPFRAGESVPWTAEQPRPVQGG